MPYVVTTKRPVDAVDCGHPEAPRDGWPISAKAVATLEEARTAAAEITLPYAPVVQPTDDAATATACWTIPESGGTVGPLPDGTVIEVRPVELGELWRRAGADNALIGKSDQATIDAFNAREAAR